MEVSKIEKNIPNKMNSPYQVIRKFLQLKPEQILILIKSLPASYFDQEKLLDTETEQKINYLKELKANSPEIYTQLIWRCKDYFEDLKSTEFTGIPPIKPYLACLQNVALRLGLETSYDPFRNELEIKIGKQPPLIFINGKTPFNQQIVADICKDKERTYNRLHSVINTPKTIGFLDPDCKPEFKPYLTAFNQQQVVDKILEWFSLPVIIKQNSGAQGKNVFLCKNIQQISQAVRQIFNKSNKNYDYLLLAQEYINIKKEYRVISYKGQIQLLYEKNTDEVKEKQVQNLSPLHQVGAKAIWINDDEIIQEIQKFITPIFEQINLEYGGLDVVIDDKDRLWLIEVNTNPGFGYFLSDNPKEVLEQMYEKILNSYLESLTITNPF